MIFAKLFEFPEHNNQLLATKTFSNEDDSVGITFRIGHPDVIAQITMGYDDEETRDWEFDGIDETKAADMFNAMAQQLTDLTNPAQTDKL